MWTRAMIKSQAKQELKFSYWKSFAVCIVAGLLGGGGGGGSSNFNDQPQSQSMGLSGVSPETIGLFAGLFGIALVFGIAYYLFVTMPIAVGKASFFLRAIQGDRRIGNLFSSFSRGRYISSVSAMFTTNLIIGLWSLLFVIPGIVKAYQYRMVPYLISEDPTLTPKQARQLSTQMTDGEKMGMFVLDLSFIGWIILGAMALVVGVFFVVPYVEATWAQLYFVLKQRVITVPGGPESIGYEFM